MLVLAVILVGVSLARFAFLHHSRLLTSGLLAIALGFVLYFPTTDHSIDPAIGDGPLGLVNASDLGHILLTLVAWCVLGVLSLRVLRRNKALHAWLERTAPHLRSGRSIGELAVRAWVVANVITAAAVVVVWSLSDLRYDEVGDMLELHDTGTNLLVGMYGGWAAFGGVLVVTASLIGLRDPRAPHAAVWVMLGVGSCGIGYTATSAVLLAIGGTDLLQQHSLTVMQVWAFPGLLLLSLSGVVGLVAELRRPAVAD
ncbi:hypothetical protein IU501_22900 [Nocardia otitidiscaviarum]|uniref:hypothetical protein n=1 Tax=Nocardia otitidiscaviarum TaxID=1823 RepID=UPI0004A757D1|nr:hypothetical protein [Nocardia otitidiscaviarum]MBF6135843.1 hypothetical protein [Nocardia otitidiscaviarum]